MLLEPQLKKIKEFKEKEVVPSLLGDTGIWESHPDPWEQIRDTSPEVSSVLSVTPLLAAVCKPLCAGWNAWRMLCLAPLFPSATWR